MVNTCLRNLKATYPTKKLVLGGDEIEIEMERHLHDCHVRRVSSS